jgi:HK97 gp10 family phage protein
LDKGALQVTLFHSPKFDLDVRITPKSSVLVNRLKDFSDKVQKKSAKKAARKAMSIVRKAAVANAKAFDNPNTPERVWKNVTVQEAPKSSKRIGGIVMRVGVKGGAKQYANTKANVRSGKAGKTYKTLGSSGNPGGDTWYWRFVEFGTSNQPAKRFLRDALESNAQAVTDALTQELSKELDKLVTAK